MDMKKIIFFSKDLKIGGMEKSLVSLLNNLVNKYDVTLVLENKEGSLLTELDSKILITEYRPFKHKNLVLRKFFNLIKRYLWIIRNYRKYHFSCSYATYSLIGARLAIASSKNNSLYIHTNYYELFEKDKLKIKSFFNSLKINKFKHLILVSNESARDLKKIYPKYNNKIKVINNIFPIKEVISSSEETLPYKFSEKTKFIFIGRLEEESKQISLLIDSFADAYLNNNNIELFIIGDGKDKSRYENQIKKLKMENNIILLGEVKNPYPYLKNADSLIITSKYEGFPVVYSEALALKTPILTTVSTSDNELNISDYAIIMKSNKNEITNTIMSFDKNKIIVKIVDFEKLNRIRLAKIEEVIS